MTEDTLKAVVEKLWKQEEQPLFLLSYMLHPRFVENFDNLGGGSYTSMQAMCESSVFYFQKFIGGDTGNLVHETLQWHQKIVRGSKSTKRVNPFYFWLVMDKLLPSLSRLAKFLMTCFAQSSTCKRLFKDFARSRGLIRSSMDRMMNRPTLCGSLTTGEATASGDIFESIASISSKQEYQRVMTVKAVQAKLGALELSSRASRSAVEHVVTASVAISEPEKSPRNLMPSMSMKDNTGVPVPVAPPAVDERPQSVSTAGVEVHDGKKEAAQLTDAEVMDTSADVALSAPGADVQQGKEQFMEKQHRQDVKGADTSPPKNTVEVTNDVPAEEGGGDDANMRVAVQQGNKLETALEEDVADGTENGAEKRMEKAGQKEEDPSTQEACTGVDKDDANVEDAEKDNGDVDSGNIDDQRKEGDDLQAANGDEDGSVEMVIDLTISSEEEDNYDEANGRTDEGEGVVEESPSRSAAQAGDEAEAELDGDGQARGDDDDRMDEDADSDVLDVISIGSSEDEDEPEEGTVGDEDDKAEEEPASVNSATTEHAPKSAGVDDKPSNSGVISARESVRSSEDNAGQSDGQGHALASSAPEALAGFENAPNNGATASSVPDPKAGSEKAPGIGVMASSDPNNGSEKAKSSNNDSKPAPGNFQATADPGLSSSVNESVNESTASEEKTSDGQMHKSDSVINELFNELDKSLQATGNANESTASEAKTADGVERQPDKVADDIRVELEKPLHSSLRADRSPTPAQVPENPPAASALSEQQKPVAVLQGILPSTDVENTVPAQSSSTATGQNVEIAPPAVGGSNAIKDPIGPPPDTAQKSRESLTNAATTVQQVTVGKDETYGECPRFALIDAALKLYSVTPSHPSHSAKTVSPEYSSRARPRLPLPAHKQSGVAEDELTGLRNRKVSLAFLLQNLNIPPFSV